MIRTGQPGLREAQNCRVKKPAETQFRVKNNCFLFSHLFGGKLGPIFKVP